MLRGRRKSKEVVEKLDLYEVLDLQNYSTREDIEHQYKIKSLRWHPAKNEHDKERSTQKFRQVCIAYEVLIDPERRSEYDRTGNYVGKFDDPIQTFTKVFGPNFDIDVVPDDPTEFIDNKRPLEQDPPVSTEFQCTLEQLYNGVTKIFDVTKNIVRDDGRHEQEKKRIHIKVKPGWKTGTKIIFPKEGDIHPGRIPADLIFVLKELEHAYYSREGDNLIYLANITLKQALKGVRLHLPFLDGSTSTQTIQKVIYPDLQHVVKRYGMPSTKKNGEYGDMIIRFQIRFPVSLNEEQKDLISSAFDTKFNIEWR